MTALFAATGGSIDGSFNIGTEIETSVLRLVELLKPHAGEHGFEPEFEPPRPGEVQRIALDSSLAGDELRWRAKVGLDEGIERTLASLKRGAVT